MSIDAMKQALEALQIGQDAFSQAFGGYGYYRPDNPHNFFPDPECCTEKEIAHHSAACEAYDKGTYIPDHSDGWITPELHVTKAPWGIGTYTDECKEITDAITALHAAIERQEKVEPIGYVRKYALEHLSKPGQTVINHAPLSDDDIALYASAPSATDSYELGKKDGWDACEVCHGIVDGKLPQHSIEAADRQEPDGYVLYRRDEDGLEAVMCYTYKPDGEFKPRFILKPYWHTSPQPAQTVEPVALTGTTRVGDTWYRTQGGYLMEEIPQPAIPAWQPIETAPRDGTPILAFTQHDNAYVVSYDDCFSAPWRIFNDQGLNERAIIYWMPLPAAPKPEEMK